MQKERIQKIIGDKYWYSHTPDGRFCFDSSVAALADALKVSDPGVVRSAIERGFLGGKGLVHVDAENEAGSEQLLTTLARLRDQYGFSLTVWTVGDESWQARKAELSGLTIGSSDIDFFCSGSDKISAIPELLAQYQCSRVLVVDDKQSNLDEVHSLCQEKGFGVLTYHMKLDNRHADQQAFIRWFEERCSEGSIDRDTLVLMDMDGVLINTNGVLFGAAAENIAQILTEKQQQ